MKDMKQAIHLATEGYSVAMLIEIATPRYLPTFVTPSLLSCCLR
jgi:hypothetical protein